MVRRILIIEDSNDDFQAILRALGRASADVMITRSLDGDDALAMLRDTSLNRTREALPEVILLDLNLPGTDGREVLAELKGDVRLKAIPVVIFSTSTHPTDVADCYQKGASGYCLKLLDRAKFDETVRAINDFWFRAVTLPGRMYLM